MGSGVFSGSLLARYVSSGSDCFVPRDPLVFGVTGLHGIEYPGWLALPWLPVDPGICNAWPFSRFRPGYPLGTA